MPRRDRVLLDLSTNPSRFSAVFSNILLRPYQLAPIHPILNSIFTHAGRSFVVIFARQSGKDELLANLIVYLLARLHYLDSSIVFVSPTFKPQTITAMNRLDARMSSPWFKNYCRRSSGYIYKFDHATCTYLSAEPGASVVGATARTLLIINEAQDVRPAIYDKRFAPMAASGNATRIFSGTSWTNNTLLARELRLARQAERADGLQRVFIVPGDQVASSNPYYAAHLQGEIARFGKNHPLIQSQYFCQEIDAQAGMFPPARQALMRGSHASRAIPEPGKMYAFLIDVAGQDECAGWLHDAAAAPADGASQPRSDLMLVNPGRDYTLLKIVEIDKSTLPTIGKPAYRVVYRQSWLGKSHVVIFGALKALAAAWQPWRIVIDATGVGEGLYSMLGTSLGSNIVLPVKFSASMKSELGYGFLAIVESGRYQEYAPVDRAFQEQLDYCTSEILMGPAKLMRWGVPDGTRNIQGGLVHDDDLVASSFCHLLDGLEWTTPTEMLIVPGLDPIKSMDRFF
jgi:hypothetical protein